ncbi:MAG: dTDP-4-dehydrorhamnose reductase [Pseudomonadota bacterium]
MIVVFGKTGQVATELALLEPEARYVPRDEVDLAKPTQVAAFLKNTQARAIINAAAYTAVDRAEDERDLAMAVNGASVGTMAEHAAARDIPLVHISTDYVFDGAGTTPHRPDDPVAPLGVYGASKLGGEALIWNAGGRHVILRTSWVFSAHGTNFVKTMLRLSEARNALSVVDDQVGGPTPARGIAETVLKITGALLDGHKGGTYHYAGAPNTSWAGFAREIFAQAGRDVSVTGIATADYPTPATRPLNSRLDCTTLETEFGVTPADWRRDLALVLKALT